MAELVNLLASLTGVNSPVVGSDLK